ncbi:hypothetical protein PF010_g24859 [Phytophthora fragariae]|uniref:WRKY19-like zinc finger domain-containing protein n=1 Tax=Phytophthora fragariae TaxID=53985 RepID=A0A6A3R6Y7_9STRA|nr:hypothetical protein PF003_g35861 [Phytophthora fragariae]KAE8929828.1 hypothetical protein PF009_g20064 [Phytophthora fragariae]KAE8976308.1 hypothetical protein PF011_g24105 [Phytophthora fragariae]KAE9073985.1 hypothetical protein PF010_g24859 [Phytophthora fragariae]KAE9090611.1 hypothetical protein PF007_g19173 [Phytophthora fragariae]
MRCSTVGCVNKAQSNGKCRTHTGVGQCTHVDCEKQAQYRGLCVAHGGRRVCTHPGCSKTVTSRGKCGDHGGGRRRSSRSKGDADSKPVTVDGNSDESQAGRSMMSLLLNKWPKEIPGLNAPSLVGSVGDAPGWHGYNDSKLEYPSTGYPTSTVYSNFAPVQQTDGYSNFAPVQQPNGSMMSLLVNEWTQEGATKQVEVKMETGNTVQDTVQVTDSKTATAGQARNSRKRALCSHSGCEKFAQSQGLCVTHGGKRCMHPNCTKSAQLRGLCVTHGGTRNCSVPGCPKSSRSAGRCFQHGGGKQCSEPGCGKQVQSKGLCSAHSKAKTESNIVQTLIL